MAMIKCPECGKEISDRAIACPNCAFPIAEAKNDGLIRIKLGTIKGIGLSGKQNVSISSNDCVLWVGIIGQIAEIKVKDVIDINIKYHLSAMHYGGSCNGTIDPNKGNKYCVLARKGIMKTILELQRVNILDAE